MDLAELMKAQIAGAAIVYPRTWMPSGTKVASRWANWQAAWTVRRRGGPRIAYRGRVWPVSPQFQAECVDPYPALARASNAALWRELILTGRRASATGLRPEERARWDAVNRHLCVRRSLDFLGDRPLAEVDMAYADQIHGNSWSLACGCILHVVFDHYERRGEAGLNRAPLHPHTPRHVCERHRRFADDLDRLHTFAGLDQAAWSAAKREAA